MNYKHLLAAAAASLGLLALAVPASAAEASTTTDTMVPMSTSSNTDHDVVLVVTHTGHYVNRATLEVVNGGGNINFEYTGSTPSGSTGPTLHQTVDCHGINGCYAFFNNINHNYPGGIVEVGGSAVFNGRTLGTPELAL